MRALPLFGITLLAVAMSACGTEEITPDQIWSGATFTFEKAGNADPTEEVNQDRLTANVWLTRSSGGGQIYNAVSESEADQDKSPKGTEWAIGSIDDVNTLEFKPFREAVGKPKSVVGKDLVLHLIEDDVYLTITFTKWGAGKSGGFAYERSMP